MEEVTLREFLEQRLDNQDALLVRIDAQVTKTNGRVTKLELFKAQAKVALAILGGSFTLIIAPAIVNWLSSFLHH